MADSANHDPSSDEPPGYPHRWSADVILRDGSTIRLRPIRPSDEAGIVGLQARLSAQTVYFRFFTPIRRLSPQMVHRFVHVEYRDRFALVGLLADQIIAVGRYERLPSAAPSAQAEVAFLVDDAHQGKGIGTVLLEHLAVAAKDAGITRFVADTLPENRRMLRVFHEAGYDDERTFADGVVRVAFDIHATEASEARMRDRERRAAASSMQRLLAPTSVALIGASRRPSSIGHHLLRSLLGGGFNGPVYPVNPEALHVNSVRAYPSVLDIPDRVDLAVVAVPASEVASVVEQCGRKAVSGIVVISSGFSEYDAAGAVTEAGLLAEARRNGMRLIGPNCMGIINTDPAIGLNASFSPMPPRGRIGLISQSGALGVVILDEMARRGLGVSTFVSAGNKADVSSNDLLQYWDDDPSTDLALLYIETFGNPRSFARVARRVSRHKPIVAVKSARSPAGQRAADARPQADAAVDALFHQTGVIRTDTLEEMFDVAQLLVAQPRPAGRRVGILAHSGGPGVLAADACVAAGLEVPDLSRATQERLAVALAGRRLPPSPSALHNPVHLAPDAEPAAFLLAAEAVLSDEHVDSVIALYTSALAVPARDVTAALATAARSSPTKPLLACVLGQRALLDTGPDARPIPSFAFPEAAARALGHVARYADWLRRPEGQLPELSDIDPERARQQLGAPDHHDLEPPAVAALLAAYGIAHGASARDGSTAVEVGVTQDPTFGPLVTLSMPGGSGHTPATSSARTLPLTDIDAADLVDVVVGTRGDQGRRRALEDVLLRIGRLAEDWPEVAELTIDPLILTAEGAGAARASARVGPWEPRPELALRRLR